jgi:AraC family transcriptional regulator, regulatory protein of adaptative response / methylated-DNA-[protein]-cysteine methyltransferase
MNLAMTSTSRQDNQRVMQTGDDDVFWQAVLSRDARFDGRIFFGVRSTGIYCRPSCPARRPRREQVVFFPIPEAAEQAGFRSCRRCHPRVPSSADPQVGMVRRACRYIEDHFDTPPTLEALSAHTGVSPYHLQRVFKRVAGITPRQYAEACRLSKFKSRVKKGESVTGAMYEAGYGSSSRLYERAPSQLGMTPADYRRGGKGTRISYTMAPCSLGRLLVAATEKGVCAVRLGDSDAELEADLLSEYPAADVERNDEALSGWVAQLLDHLEGARPHLDLPLDVQATAFQWNVWDKLREIPYGGTRSYSEIAKAIGRPTAARAVARAIATNPVALVVPCHRVIHEDRSLGGYRWGLKRKQALLERERSADGSGQIDSAPQD